MNILFQKKYLEDLYVSPKLGKKPKFSKSVIKGFKETIRILKLIDTSRDLYDFKSFHFEKLKGELQGSHSIRIDKKYRLIFRIEKDEILIEEVLIIEDLTNHYDD